MVAMTLGMLEVLISQFFQKQRFISMIDMEK